MARLFCKRAPLAIQKITPLKITPPLDRSTCFRPAPASSRLPEGLGPNRASSSRRLARLAHIIYNAEVNNSLITNGKARSGTRPRDSTRRNQPAYKRDFTFWMDENFWAAVLIRLKGGTMTPAPEDTSALHHLLHHHRLGLWHTCNLTL